MDRKWRYSEFMGILMGALSSWTVSHSRSPVTGRLPKKGYKKIELLPNLKISRGDNKYHIHHWVYFSLLYIPFVASRRLSNRKLMKGFVIGAVLQGLTYKDRFRVKELE